MNWESVFKYLLKFEPFSVLAAIVFSFIEYSIKIVPSGSGLPFKEFNEFFVLIAVLSANMLIIKVITKIWGNAQTKRDNQKYREIQNSENVQILWDFVDKLIPEDHQFVMELLLNENKPIYDTGSYSYDSLHGNTQLISKVLCRDPKKAEEMKSIVYKPNGEIFGYMDATVTEYRLTDSFYNNLKYSYYKYGKISFSNCEKDDLAKSGLKTSVKGNMK